MVCFGQALAAAGELDGADWPAVYQSRYPQSWGYHLKTCFNRTRMLLLRDKAFVKSQIMSSLVMGESYRRFALVLRRMVHV